MRDIATLTKTMMTEAAHGENSTGRLPELELANNVFKVLHGSYPKFFLSNFETGQLDQSGHDKGVKNGRNMWASKLSGFSQQVIGAALDQCLERYVVYPPNLPQFLVLCRANQPRVTYAEQFPALPDHAPRPEQAAKMRELRDRITRQSAPEEPATPTNGLDELKVLSLDELKVLIAQAAALEGHDEATILRALDVMLAPRKPPEKV